MAVQTAPGSPARPHAHGSRVETLNPFGGGYDALRFRVRAIRAFAFMIVRDA